MKKSLLLTYSFSILMLFQSSFALRFIHLEDKAIHWVDGITGLLDAEAIRDTLDVRRIINNIIHGVKNKATGLYEKEYDLAGWPEKISLNDVIKLYIMYTKEGISHDDPRMIALNDPLNAMKKNFYALTKPLLNTAAQAIKVNMRLIKEWTTKAGRTDSILTQWGTLDEEKALRESNPMQFKQFIIDLQNFLKDLMFSCPKARKKYAEHYIKDPAKQQDFEDIFIQKP